MSKKIIKLFRTIQGLFLRLIGLLLSLVAQLLKKSAWSLHLIADEAAPLARDRSEVDFLVGERLRKIADMK